MNATDSTGCHHLDVREARQNECRRDGRRTVRALGNSETQLARRNLPDAGPLEEALQIVWLQSERRYSARDPRHCRCRAVLLYGPRHPDAGVAVGGDRKALRQNGAFQSDDGPALGACFLDGGRKTDRPGGAHADKLRSRGSAQLFLEALEIGSAVTIRRSGAVPR